MKRITSRSGAAGAVVLAAGVAATAAFAVPPPPSSVFDGNTSQTSVKDHRVEVQTNSAGHVKAVYVQWRAKCKAKGKFWRSTTKASKSGGLPESGDAFSYKHTYKARIFDEDDQPTDITGTITYTLKGSFSDNDNVAGTWTAKVIVKKKRKKIDTCKLPKITWTAKRVEEQQG